MTDFLFLIFRYLVSFCSAWLTMHAMGYLIKIKHHSFKKFLMLMMCWLLDNVVIFMGDPFNILAIIPSFLIAILICCEGSLWKKVTIGTMIASTILSFNALRDNYVNPLIYELIQHIARPQTVYGGFIFLQTDLSLRQSWSVLVSLPCNVFLYAGIRKFSPDQDYILSDSLWRLLLLLTFTPFGIVLTLTTLYSYNSYGYISHSFMPPIEHLVLLSITILAFISLLWCITVLAKQQKLEQQNMFTEINRKYYEAMEQQHFEIRRLKHDLANHLQVLSALPEEQRDVYLKSLTENTAFTQPLSYCGDPTVNAVLTVKKNQMERYDICMKSEIDIPAKLPFDRTDICALYANALDNAAEACMKLESDERVITLKSKAQKGLFCLEVSNPILNPSENTYGSIPSGIPEYDTVYSDPAKSFSIPPTSKPDKANHGFGLKGIKEITERYHGSLELKTVNGIFNLFLYIPLSQSKNHSATCR